jgi:hypothetical protein
MKRISVIRPLFLILALMMLAGCAGSSGSNTSTALSSGNINLIFVVSPDLAYQTPGDVTPDKANLTNRGFQRSLRMGTYLKNNVLGTNNVTGIYALEPMTHLQTANNYPDMAAIWFIQQFALLNQITVGGTTANSFTINTAYAPGDVPGGVVVPTPYVTGAQGLAFNDAHGNNVALVTRIINANIPGFYVFSAPWETISALMTNINNQQSYNLNLPAGFQGSNTVFAISITPSGAASLVTFNSYLYPPDTYPVLPIASASCTQQTYFSYTLTDGVNGVIVPAGANTNETVYLIRHVEAHPSNSFEDGNYVAAGQWRALSLPNFMPYALRGQASPTVVYSIDPAQSFSLGGGFDISYVRPSLTVLPYAVANNLPYYLIAGFNIGTNPNDPAAAQATSDFLFTNLGGANLSNQTVLIAWEHEHYPPLISYLLQSYGVTVPSSALPWPSPDYDTIWRVKLDAHGNLTVDNALCEGIDSAALPDTAPQF